MFCVRSTSLGNTCVGHQSKEGRIWHPSLLVTLALLRYKKIIVSQYIYSALLHQTLTILYNIAPVWSLFQNAPDCPSYPTERYTVDIDGVQIANMTVLELESLTTDHTNGSVTLSLPLTQRLSENAVTVNMTKFNTVPTNMSDDMGNIVTEKVTWSISAFHSEPDVPR